MQKNWQWTYTILKSHRCMRNRTYIIATFAVFGCSFIHKTLVGPVTLREPLQKVSQGQRCNAESFWLPLSRAISSEILRLLSRSRFLQAYPCHQQDQELWVNALCAWEDSAFSYLFCSKQMLGLLTWKSLSCPWRDWTFAGRAPCSEGPVIHPTLLQTLHFSTEQHNINKQFISKVQYIYKNRKSLK